VVALFPGRLDHHLPFLILLLPLPRLGHPLPRLLPLPRELLRWKKGESARGGVCFR